MVLPSDISKNTIKVYHIDGIPFKPTNRIISVNLSQWRENIPKNLSELCIEAIAKNWEVNPLINELPLLSDVIKLIDILPTDLPLELTVPHVAYDSYWLRCYESRWPRKPPLRRNFSEVETLFDNRKTVTKSVSSLESIFSKISSKRNSQTSVISRKSSESTLNLTDVRKTWKELYLEMHVQEYLEELDPEQYDPEKIKNLSQLCKQYVTVLKLNELRSPLSKEVPDHIPLNSVLTGFDHLQELSLCFKQKYIGEKFSWHIFNTTMIDIKHLAKGLENSKLKLLRIQNSDINCTKLKMLLKGLSKNSSLTELEVSHCKVADHGAMAVAKYLQQHPNIRKLNLINNYIGFEGVRSLAYLLMGDTSLVHLNIRLNIINSKGGKYLYFALTKGQSSLRELIVAGCGLNGRNVEIEEFLRTNKSLKKLDFSNNRMGEDIGKLILKTIRFNTSLTDLDCRRCHFEPETEAKISEIVNNNRHEKYTREVCWDKLQFPFVETVGDLFSETFVNDFNSIFSE